MPTSGVDRVTGWPPLLPKLYSTAALPSTEMVKPSKLSSSLVRLRPFSRNFCRSAGPVGDGIAFSFAMPALQIALTFVWYALVAASAAIFPSASACESVMRGMRGMRWMRFGR